LSIAKAGMPFTKWICESLFVSCSWRSVSKLEKKVWRRHPLCPNLWKAYIRTGNNFKSFTFPTDLSNGITDTGQLMVFIRGAANDFQDHEKFASSWGFRETMTCEVLFLKEMKGLFGNGLE
jgi:hypothetical protein